MVELESTDKLELVLRNSYLFNILYIKRRNKKMASVMNANESNFQEEVLDSNTPVLVDFWAPWCGYCSRLSPVLDSFAAEAGDKIKIVKVNVDENRSLTQKYGVMSLPTMIMFKNGEPGEKLLGYMPKESLSAKIMPLL